MKPDVQDDLPHEVSTMQLLDVGELTRLVRLSRVTIWRLEQQDEFPKEVCINYFPIVLV